MLLDADAAAEDEGFDAEGGVVGSAAGASAARFIIRSHTADSCSNFLMSFFLKQVMVCRSG